MSRFRTEYRELTPDEKELVNNIKHIAEMLEEEIYLVRPPREMSLALSRLEEAVMWAVKGVTG